MSFVAFMVGISVGCLWMGLSVISAIWWAMACAKRDQFQDHSTASQRF